MVMVLDCSDISGGVVDSWEGDTPVEGESPSYRNELRDTLEGVLSASSFAVCSGVTPGDPENISEAVGSSFRDTPCGWNLSDGVLMVVD